MDPSASWQILILVMLISMSAFFSASETALTSVSKIRIRHLMGEGVKNAKKVNSLISDPEKLLGVILIGNNIVNIGASALATVLALDLFGSAGVGIATGVMTLLVLIFGEITPKSWAVQHAEVFSLRIAGLIKVLIKILGPAVYVLLMISRGLMRLSGSEAGKKAALITEDELRTLVDISHEEGILQGSEKDMIQNVFEFGDLQVRYVMTPRTDIVALEVGASFDEVVRTIREEQFSRIPVYESEKDNVIGLLYAKDLIGVVCPKEFALRDYLKPPLFTYEFHRIRNLFDQFRTEQIPVAIVLDEYGGTVGLVTMEDLVEEILGDLWEEFDDLEFTSVIVHKQEILAGGSARLDEINDLLGTSFESREFDSLGGFILTELGYLPGAGAIISRSGFDFKVEEMQRNRITKVRITKSPVS